MGLMSAKAAGEKWGISQRRVAVLCAEDRIPGALLIGHSWVIPDDAEKPEDARSTRRENDDETRVRPFLKWAGGKGQLLGEIAKYYPFNSGEITKYAEPFVGGGAVLFDILSRYKLDKRCERRADKRIHGDPRLSGTADRLADGYAARVHPNGRRRQEGVLHVGEVKVQ